MEFYKGQKNSNSRLLIYTLVMIILIYVFVYMPTPYVIYGPGSAEEIKPFVTVVKGDTEEKGTFMLTTVLRKKANVALMIGSAFDSNAQLSKENLGGRTEQEYANEQIFYMSNSQSNAMMSAYKHANIPYEIEMAKLLVMYNDPNLATHNDFQSGDELVSLEGVKFKKYDDLIALLKTKKVGDVVHGKVVRNGKETDVSAQLIEMKDSQGNVKAGIGLRFGIIQDIKPKDPAKQIKFNLKDIGGPSAGLMFTLEIYNQLTPGDLSKGYRIAGTGTMSPDGTVGPIGGVQHKIVAADREKAEIFFVPEGNYAEAKKKYDSIETPMKLVSVRTVDDALNYLGKLPEKTGK